MRGLYVYVCSLRAFELNQQCYKMLSPLTQATTTQTISTPRKQHTEKHAQTRYKHTHTTNTSMRIDRRAVRRHHLDRLRSSYVRGELMLRRIQLRRIGLHQR